MEIETYMHMDRYNTTKICFQRKIMYSYDTPLQKYNHKGTEGVKYQHEAKGILGTDMNQKIAIKISNLVE